MIPAWRKPVSASTKSFIPCHSRRLSMIKGSSRGSRPILRHQPQLRLDCSWAMCPFSHSATETPFRAKNSAVLVPMIPPPTMTTSTRVGRASSEGTESTRGPMLFPLASLTARSHHVNRDPAGSRSDLVAMARKNPADCGTVGPLTDVLRRLRTAHSGLLRSRTTRTGHRRISVRIGRRAAIWMH
jgi:hypothetical protein